jgi:predicted metal-dependent hydrolase
VLGLRDHADALSGSLQAGETLTQSLISKAETLLTALDASAREIDETLPASFARLKATADEGGQAVASIAPGLKEVETTAAETLARIKEAEALIAAQRGQIEELSAAARTTMAGNADAIAKLTTEIAAADAEARKLAEASGAQLVEALVRIKDTATQASEHTRQALTALVPESAEALGEQARTALEKALTEQVDAQMSEIAAKAEAAVESAQKATDRLMRQMLTISETSAALEARIAEAKQDVERADHSSFSRRVALLIESLNSTAIDVTKILSNEVTDTAWAAYLRGDRGVFTRRAVRLLDTGEAREIVRHYEEEPEFREQVNRYVHDFEAMLRNVLSTRDGTPLSVTLLSSDAGKLYVALAQAIDRLRS